MTTGLSVRTGVIGSIFRKSLRISGRGRADHSVGQITTMISADATRMDRFTYFGHVYVVPIALVRFALMGRTGFGSHLSSSLLE